MQYEKKYYGNGTGNFDDADFILEPNQWVNMENCRVRSTDKGVVGTVESISSTTLISSPLPSLTFICIGSTVDEENQRILYFLKDRYSVNDRIVCYQLIDKTFYVVLYNDQVVGGLNFNKNNLIHSARIINGLLYWTDNINQPCKIDINAGIKLNYPGYDTKAIPYISPIEAREITIIKAPPALAPNISKNYDSSFVNNFIANDSFRFAYQYVYNNNEISVVGTYSPASRLNKVSDNFNRVVVSMDPSEVIPQTVKIVNLIVRIDASAFIIKTWDKTIASELTEIQNQNNGSAQLTYNFYNNITGEAISTDQILKPFDSVPIKSGALEIAKNRLLLGNNLAGYDTPITTSLTNSVTTIPISGSGISKNLIKFTAPHILTVTTQSYSGWYVYLTEVSPVGYYAIVSTEQYCASGCPLGYPPLPPPPTTEALSALAFRGSDTVDVVNNSTHGINATYGLSIPDFFTFYETTSNIVNITGMTTTTYDIFKSFAQYKLGVVFYDFAMRKCGVVTKPFSSSTNDPTLALTPARDFLMSSGSGSIVWNLSNADAINEIPDWAYYYTIVRTLNLRTRYFIQALQQTSSAKYVTRDSSGVYEFTNNTFVSGAVGIGLDTTSLTQAGLGYSFTQGDVCILIKEDSTTYTLSVIDQSGKYIIVNVPEGGIGDLTAFKILYEIYTPYQPSNQEPYYEVGEMYLVTNPATDFRNYSATSGLLLPDAYALTRNFDSVTYFAEGMSPNDRFFSRWDNDTGKVNYVVKGGQVSKPEFFSFSNVYIPGTATNGLSTFEDLNQSNVPKENGAIQKLILTSKTQDQGSVLLAICSNETSSIYLGETRILDNTGATQFFSASTGYVGSINSLKGSFGTINPESVVEFRGNVYWVDVLNGKVIQYSANGLFPISSYKMTKFWKLFCEQYYSMTKAEVEELGNRPYIFSTVDPHHWELLITVPRVLAIPPKGYLPDIPEMIYPFDIWDGQSKTLVYKINAEPNFWQGAYSFSGENYVTFENALFSFSNGNMYLHNQTDQYCNFYGLQYKSRIMGISNQVPNRPKSYNNISIEVNMLPSLVYFLSEQPYQQVSNLQDFDFEVKEGNLFCQIYRNVLTPSATGLQDNALITGEKMRTYALRILLEFSVTTFPVELRFFTIGYSISLGHTT